MPTPTSPAHLTVSSSVLAQLFVYLASLQVDIDGFLRSLGIDPAEVKSPDARLRHSTYLLIQDQAAETINDPYLGLHMGEYADAGSWSILGYMMMNCKTMADAFQKASRYQRIIGNMIEGRGDLQGDRVKLIVFTPPHAPAMSRHCFEATISSSVRMVRNLTQAPINPLEVTFTYPQPASTAEYERIFGCPVLFDQPENSYTLALQDLFTPIPLANPSLLAYFEKYAQDFLNEMDHRDEYTRSVTKIILAHLDDEALTIEKVAQEMAVSVRTLQSRLDQEGVVFSELLKEIRERLAKKYLRENYSVEQITYLLGFSEPSVFRKAFKKWSGVTPREYRQRAFSSMGQA
jgi:AraC-like DNA-binding protein